MCIHLPYFYESPTGGGYGNRFFWNQNKLPDRLRISRWVSLYTIQNLFYFYFYFFHLLRMCLSRYNTLRKGHRPSSSSPTTISEFLFKTPRFFKKYIPVATKVLYWRRWFLLAESPAGQFRYHFFFNSTTAHQMTPCGTMYICKEKGVPRKTWQHFSFNL